MNRFIKYLFATSAFFFLTLGFLYAEEKTIVQESDSAQFAIVENQQNTKDKKTTQHDEEWSFFNRYWELGVKLDVNVSNSYFTLSDFLKETVVIDFSEMADTMTYRGLTINPVVGAHVFSNIYTKKVSFGFDFGADVISNIALQKDLIAFLATGNKIDEDMNLGVGLGAAVFADFNIPVSFKIADKLKMKTQLSYFLPIVYVPYIDGVVKTRFNSDGSIVMEGDAIASVYSCVNLNDMSQFDVAKVLAQGGFDVSIEAEYELLSFLDLGFSAKSIPIVPSRLDPSFSYKLGVSFVTEDALLNDLINGVNIKDSFHYYFEPGEEVGSRLNVLRPLKLGMWVNWRPLNNDYLILTPLIQCRFIDPTVANSVGFGFDYSLRLSTDLDWFKAGFTTCYIDNIFKQQIDFILNGRFIEFDFILSSQSASFAKSFCGSGLGLGIGFIIGF